MSEAEKRTRELAGVIVSLVNQLQFMKLDGAPPDYEFNFRELRVILFIGHNQSCIMRELSDALGIAESTTTGLVDRMVDKGLVVRESDKQDRRIVRLKLTDRGMEVYQWDFEGHVSFLSGALQSLNTKDQDTFVALMNKIVDNTDNKK